MYYYGKNTIKSLLETSKMIDTIYVSDKFHDANIMDLIKAKRVKYQLLSDAQLDQMTNKAKHQRIVAKVNDYQYKDLDGLLKKTKDAEHDTVLILDGIEDPQNFGSMIRTGEALKISGIIIPKKRSVKVTPTVAKVSTGALENVDIVQVTNLKQAISKLKENGYWIVSADMDTETLYNQVDYQTKIALIIGAEGSGVSKSILKASDYVVKLPMYGKVSSLNAATAAAIIMYQINSNRTH